MTRHLQVSLQYWAYACLIILEKQSEARLLADRSSAAAGGSSDDRHSRAEAGSDKGSSQAAACAGSKIVYADYSESQVTVRFELVPILFA